MGLGVLPERHRLAVSPLNRRRWQSFKANGRGYWSFFIFMVLFLISLSAEFIANDKPFYLRFDGRSYFPVFVNYPETAFGGDFETAADYRDPYLQKLIDEKGGFMLWPPIRYSYNTHNLDLPTPAPSPPKPPSPPSAVLVVLVVVVVWVVPPVPGTLASPSSAVSPLAQLHAAPTTRPKIA